jgi:7-cyano-7-deazaguanine synthase
MIGQVERVESDDPGTVDEAARKELTPMAKPRSIVAFSGGMDSATLIYHLRNQGHEVIALSVDYGQRHRIELSFAARFAEFVGIQRELADLSGITRLLGGSSLTDPSLPVPLGHYESETMKQTVVPNRNMLLLAIATAFAVSQRAQYVAYAAHTGDHAIYPDCRPEFTDAMAKAISLCDWHTPELIRPFEKLAKADIVREGAALGVPFDLTWSCYEGGERHCGACGTCIERREAFLIATVKDPTEYAESAPAMVISNAKVNIDWSRTLSGGGRAKSERVKEI